MGRFGAAELAAPLKPKAKWPAALRCDGRTGRRDPGRLFYGARDPLGVKRAGWVALGIGTGFMALTALAMLLFPEVLLSIYVDPSDPANAALLVFALQYLVLAAIFQLADGVQAVAAGALRGLQDTRVPMWIAIFSYWVPGIGMSIGLGFFTPLEGTGVWIGLATGLFFAAALLIGRWYRREALGLTTRASHVIVTPLPQPS